MSIGTIAMLVGLFGVPVFLLWSGHRLRRRTPRQRAMFWGALVGYGVASLAALAVSISPAAMWDANDTLRGVLGFWSFIIGGVLGAAGGLVFSRRN
jgi:hypothetical protein